MARPTYKMLSQPNWNDFVGLPFRRGGRDRSGIDCYGLIRLYLREQAGVELPEHHDSFDFLEIAKLIASEARNGPWRTVPASERRAFDVVLMMNFPLIGERRVKLPCHVGVMVDHNYMLDIDDGALSNRCRVDHPIIKGRVAGYYRHEQLI